MCVIKFLENRFEDLTNVMVNFNMETFTSRDTLLDPNKHNLVKFLLLRSDISGMSVSKLDFSRALGSRRTGHSQI